MTHAPIGQIPQPVRGAIYVLLATILFIPSCQTTEKVFSYTGIPTLLKQEPLPPDALTMQVSDDDGITSGNVVLASAIHETASFTFTLQAKVPVNNIALVVSPLVSTNGQLDPSHITIYQREAVSAGTPAGWHIRYVAPSERTIEPLDLLKPVIAKGNKPPTINLNDTPSSFWVDIHIPKGTFTGNHTGTINIMYQDAALGSIPIEVNVLPFVLPDTPVFSAIAEVDHAALFDHLLTGKDRQTARSLRDWYTSPLGGQLDAMIRSTAVLLRDHKIDAVFPNLLPRSSLDRNGQLTIDWSGYDDLVEPLLSGRLFRDRRPPAHWLLPLMPLSPAPATEQSRYEPAVDFARLAAAHAEEKGWRSRSFAQLDLTNQQPAIARMVDVLSRGDFRVPIATIGTPADLSAAGRSHPPALQRQEAVSIWQTPAQLFDKSFVTAMARDETAAWLYPDRPPYSGTIHLQGKPADTLVLAWQTLALRASALWLGPINRWPSLGEDPVASAHQLIKHDPSILLYPGKEPNNITLYPSARLKRIRRSMEDAAYLALLKQHGLEYVASTLLEGISPYAGTDAAQTHFADGRLPGWPSDERIYALARRIMQGELTVKLRPSGEETEALKRRNQLDWRRWTIETRKLMLDVEGIRIHSPAIATSNEFLVEFHLNLTNLGPTPVGGTITLDNPPAGWTIANPNHTVKPIARGQRSREIIKAKVILLERNADGHLLIPLRWTTDDGREAKPEAILSVMAAPVASQPIIMDGDLSDWPMAIDNVGGGFLLISPAAESRGLASRHPSHRTWVFALRTETHLYLGLNAELPPAETWEAGSRKKVTYEDGIPIGEELIEILIDPYNSASRAPSDLYHLVLKRSGTDFIEKGVDFQPAVGPRVPIAADMDVQIRTWSDRWTAEISLPLQTFGNRISQTMWGFNVTRFDYHRSEFSTWSGVELNAYDPLSFGNLYFPPAP